MTHDAQVIPTLPSRSLLQTLAFYKRLGFDGALIGGDYAILKRGSIEIHFFSHPDLKPEDCYSGCYVRMPEVDSLHAELSTAGLPPRGIPRMEPVDNRPWGMREFALLDEDGNLLKFGQIVAR